MRNKRNIPRVCPQCGAGFLVYPSRLKHCPTPCCSLRCASDLRIKKHGMSYTSEYRIWSGMRSRCENPSRHEFPNYGGRGIMVCPEWSSFNRFYADMGPRPSLRHSLDRIDNDGPYSPENCRWATPSQQLRNRRNNVLLTYEGRTATLSEWSEILGINRSTMAGRVNDGLSIEMILSRERLPIGRPKKTP